MSTFETISLSTLAYSIFALAVCLFLKDLANDDDDNHPAT